MCIAYEHKKQAENKCIHLFCFKHGLLHVLLLYVDRDVGDVIISVFLCQYGVLSDW